MSHPTAEAGPLVSVIIPNYNYARFLPAAIDSVLGQTHRRVEAIVVDDGSTDGSWEVIQGYGDRVRSFRQKNRGVSSARNLGIGESRGELLAFLDADDVWAPEKLAKQLARFADPSVGMVFCGYQEVDESGNRIGAARLNGLRGRVLREHALMREPSILILSSAAVIRRDCLDRVGFFDEALSTSADWDMARRIAGLYAVDFVPEPLVSYRQHRNSMHYNVDLLHRDMEIALSTMFSDPAASDVHPLRNLSYSNFYMMLSGAYLHNGKWGKCIEFAARGIAANPRNIATLLGYPARVARRRLRPEMSPPAIR